MPVPYTVFMLLQATPHWLALDREQRDALRDDALSRVFNHFPEVTLRFFDASAFHGRCSEVLVWETGDLPEYREALDALRSHDLLGKPCFEVVDVIASVAEIWPSATAATNVVLARAGVF
jgi:hypothetical protein